MQVNKHIWVFPSNKSNEGVISWWLDCDPEPVLIDCPVITTELIEDLKELANGRTPKILLTSKFSHNNVKELLKSLSWPVLVQEQEAYLLPGLDKLESFSEEFHTSSALRLLWTPGPTPGSCVVYAPSPWNVLFCGRLLIPVSSYKLAALRTKQTFHWTIYKRSLSKLEKWLPRDARPSLASGQGLFADGEDKLLDWNAWGKA